MQHGAEADSAQAPLLMGDGDADAESGDNDGMGMDNEVGDDSGDNFRNKLNHHFYGFDDKVIDALGDEDLADIQTVNSILNISRCKRRVVFFHERINWERHVREIQETDVQASGNTGFEECFHMRPHHFDHLHDVIKEYISVDVKRSMASTQGNDPIHPELVMACGLRFLDLDSKIPDF
jgi:hypothetical protein